MEKAKRHGKAYSKRAQRPLPPSRIYCRRSLTPQSVASFSGYVLSTAQIHAEGRPVTTKGTLTTEQRLRKLERHKRSHINLQPAWHPLTHSLHFCSWFLCPFLGFHFPLISIPDKASSSIFLVNKAVRSLRAGLLRPHLEVGLQLRSWATSLSCSPLRHFPQLVFLSLAYCLIFLF